MNETDSVFRAALETAFPCGPPCQRVLVGGTSNDPEFKSIVNRLAGRRWNEITLSSLCDNRAFDANILVGVLSDEAFFYYLPAFLAISHEASESRWESEAIAEGVVQRFVDYLKTPEILGRVTAPQASMVMPLIEKKLGDHSPKKVTRLRSILLQQLICRNNSLTAVSQTRPGRPA